MERKFVNVGQYKYLVEYFNANNDMNNNQYYAEFVMLRNFTVLNNIVYDNDIYIIERKHLNEYIEELKNNKVDYGNSLAFPITNLNNNSYSNSYKKFNDIFNIYDNEADNINASLFDGDKLSNNVYELYSIENNELKVEKIKCDKIKLYHPLVKNNLNIIIDVCNYINGINFHYLCKPINQYELKTETEIKIDNDIYSEYVEIYFPNINELFKNENGKYKIYYKEDFNIVVSSKNEKFINSILNNSNDLEHALSIDNAQIVPLNLLIQPFRIIEEYDSEAEENYNDTVADDEKTFVKLYLKNNLATSNDYSSNFSIIFYPFKEIDSFSNIYILSDDLRPGYFHTFNESKFKLMSRLGFTDGIISVVSLFDYPNKSYFYSLYKNDTSTSPLKEAYKYYNNIEEKFYNIYINEEIEKEFEEIDNIESINDEIMNMVKQVSNVNYSNKSELLDEWKKIMKETILNEYEEEFKTPVDFLGFKIQIATDISFKHIIYDKNIKVNFNEIDDFSFKLNNIFKSWSEKPEKLIVKINFYDRLLGIILSSNLIIITKEWFKYLINDTNVSYKLNKLSSLNKNLENKEYMNVIDLNDKNTNVNFINNIKCIVNKKEQNSKYINKIYDKKIILKPIFYKVKDLQNISLRPNIKQNIGINLGDYVSKIGTFKIVIENTEYIEIGRNNIIVIFNINSSNINETSGTYNLIDDAGNYISSGNYNII